MRKKPYTVAIIQARMGSSRFPGKVMMPILKRPLLSYVIERLQRCTLCDDIVVATTKNPKDQTIIDFCRKEHVYFFVGDEKDVLDRYLEAAKNVGAEVIVRVTADCPLIDPKVVDQCIQTLLDHGPSCDYVSNVIERTYPRGLDVEVFLMSCLEQVKRYAKSPEELEHVTTYILHHLDRFNIFSLTQPNNTSNYRLTVDTQEDFDLIKKIIELLYPIKENFTTEDVIKLLKEHPEWLEINAHVRQKQVKRI